MFFFFIHYQIYVIAQVGDGHRGDIAVDKIELSTDSNCSLIPSHARIINGGKLMSDCFVVVLLFILLAN